MGDQGLFLAGIREKKTAKRNQPNIYYYFYKHDLFAYFKVGDCYTCGNHRYLYSWIRCMEVLFLEGWFIKEIFA